MRLSVKADRLGPFDSRDTCAYGISSLAICDAIKDRGAPRHRIIDPFQATEWRGIGLLNLRRAGVGFAEWIEERSEYALPRLAKADSDSVDLVLIDGWHTFDHTILDIFYADRLIRVGGYIVIDDATWASVSRACAYLSTYPNYEFCGQTRDSHMSARRRLAKLVLSLVPEMLRDWLFPKAIHDMIARARFSSMVVFRKTGADRRSWTWYRHF